MLWPGLLYIPADCFRSRIHRDMRHPTISSPTACMPSFASAAFTLSLTTYFSAAGMSTQVYPGYLSIKRRASSLVKIRGRSQN